MEDRELKMFNYVSEFVAENGRGDVLLSSDYKNKSSKLMFLCFLCKETYFLDWDHFKRGGRCQNCAKKIGPKKQRHSIEYISDYILQKGEGDYLISKVYENERSVLTLFCSKHNGEYSITFNNFKQGRRCSFCSKIIKNKKRNSTIIATNGSLKDSFPEVIKDWDYLANSLTPSDYTPKSNKLVNWICSVCRYEYRMTICNRTRRTWTCPICSNKRIDSNGNLKIAKWLSDENISFCREKRFYDCRDSKPLPFDFLIEFESHILAIEFQGRQHYEPVDFFNKSNDFNRAEKFQKSLHHDEIKRDYCAKNGIRLISIPYWEYDNIENILNGELIKCQKEET